MRKSNYYVRFQRAEGGVISVLEQIVNGPLRCDTKFIKVVEPYVPRYRE